MERFETICKTAYGFTDENLLTFHKFFSERVIPGPLEEYNVNGLGVSVWLEPCVVWELKGADLQISPVYTAAIGEVDPKKGMGLRFPRFSKERPDKKPTEATSSAMIAELYKSQASVANKNSLKDDDDLQFY